MARYLAQAANSLTSVNLIYEVNSFPESVSEPHAFQLFLSNVKQENTAGLIVPVRMNSHQAASALNVVADFIKIEATSDNIYSDILAWYPHLSQTGILAGNNWNDSSVALGVMQAAESLDLSVNINASVWYFVKNAP